ALIINSAIGIFQELRAKITLDKLSILNAPTVRAIRDGKTVEITVEAVVKDDYLRIKLGDQVVADGEILDAEGLEIDESLLTGESDPIFKKAGDTVLSGSIVVAGKGIMRADKVGAESYSAELTAKAKRFKRASSELVAGTNKLLRWISWLLVPVVPLLLFGQLRLDYGDWQQAVVHSTAAIVGMIPEGLVLLTSTAFMLAVIQLARRKVLVQQMPAVETLARVDTLLLDKTGTLTEGDIKFEAVVLAQPDSSQSVDSVLATIASRADSPTNTAIAKALDKTKPSAFDREIAFNSGRKWSAIEIAGEKWLFGAPEVIFAKSKRASLFKKAQTIASEGKRVLALVRIDSWPDESYTIPSFQPAALVVLSENIRDDAAQILQFFREQQVNIKVISGDSPLTVAAVARRVNLGEVAVFDARDLPDPKRSATAKAKFNRIIRNHNVFGRVQPEQKRLICAALQDSGRVVAMTGDGVNDALALKKSDLGIAMNSGAAATKAVAEIVLLDNKFSSLPSVLAEGRRVIANIERVANLFVIKNVYSLLLALSVTVAGQAYPYLPSQMTVISVLSIGVPAFFLALAPNQQLYRPGFLTRVLKFAIPVGFIAAAAMMVNYTLLDHRGASMAVIGTSVSITMMIIGMSVLVLLARPLKGWKLGLIAACAVSFIAVITIPAIAHRFQYDLDLATLPVTILIGGIGAALVWLVRMRRG
ncbi:MAG: HAD-IC family P-type ATPase, partial [Sphaerimonospora mesophila]